MRVLLMLVPALVLAACGSDGDKPQGGGFVPQPAIGGVDVVLLQEYRFGISATDGADPLTARVPGGDGVLGFSIDFGDTLVGEVGFEVDDGNYLRVHHYTVDALSSLTVNSDVGDAAFLGAFDVEVIDDLVYMPNVPHHPPNRGFYQVITAEEIVNVQVIPGPFSSVEISLGVGPAIWMSWGQLADLLDDDLAPAWQRRAALATQVLDLVLIQMATITETFNFINDDLLVTNPAVIACDAFTGTPPALVLPEGESTLTWLGPGSGPGTGDDFEWAFTECWFDDPGSGHDALFDGSLGLHDFVWEVDNLSQLVRTGFREVSHWDLVIAGTVENANQVFTISPEDVVTLSGSFDLVFEAPED